MSRRRTLPLPLRHALIALLGAAAPLLTACSYAVEGRVVKGDVSMVELVSSNDPRLDDPSLSLSGVAVHVQSDPTKIRRKTLGRTVSSRDGGFRVPVDEFAAGVMEFDLGVFARKKGYEPAEGFFAKPSSSKRVLITMTPGQDKPTTEQPESLREEFGDQLLR
ncbi:MAG: hypothetical protein ACKVZJ_09935 [Phycisphaerales bacterium]